MDDPPVEQLVPIGRFSSMTRLSVKALRHYDELGLLPPARVDPGSGYRYYRLGQANEAEAIRVLRGLGLPLGEIAELLTTGDPEVVAKRLAVQRELIAAELAERERRLRLVEALMAREEPVVPYAVETKTVDEVRVASLRRAPSWSTMTDEIHAGFGAITAALDAVGARPAGRPVIVFHQVIDEESPGDIELCVPVTADTELADAADAADTPTIGHLAGGLVASTVHRGRYDEIAPAYHVLEGWILQHGHHGVQPPRECYLNDPTETPDEELLTEVQVPIA